MINFYHKKETDMLKSGPTFTGLANISLHWSTTHNFRTFFEGDNEFRKKFREDMTGGPSVVMQRCFTRKA